MRGILSLESLDTVDSTLLASSVRVKIHSVSPPNLPTYVELLEVMDRTMDRFDLAWWCERRVKTYTSLVQIFTKTSEEPGPSQSEDWRLGQRVSVATHTLPLPKCRAQRRWNMRRKQDLRKVIQRKKSK